MPNSAFRISLAPHSSLLTPSKKIWKKYLVLPVVKYILLIVLADRWRDRPVKETALLKKFKFVYNSKRVCRKNKENIRKVMTPGRVCHTIYIIETGSAYIKILTISLLTQRGRL